MASLVLTGDTSGQVTLAAPAVAGTNTLTLQAATATSAINTLATAKAYNWNGLTTNTSLDFTDLPSWIKRVTVMLQGVSTNGTSLPQIQIGSGSFSTSGYASAANYGIGAGQFTGTVTSGFVLEPSGGATAANLRSGSVILTLINSNTWVSQGVIYSSSLTFNNMSAGASPALGGALDRIRLTTVLGVDTFDAGSVNILYEG